MSVRKMVVLAALCALAAMSVVASASAVTNLREGSATGSIIPSGTWVMGQQTGTSVLTTSIGNISCTTGYVNVQVGASGGATVSGTIFATDANHAAPGDLVFGDPNSAKCSDNVAFADITYCNINTTFTSGTVTATTTGGTVNVGGLQVICHLNTGGNCIFTANTNQTGTYTNSTNTLDFNNIGATGPNTLSCPIASGGFTASYNPVQVTTGGTGVTPGSGALFITQS